MEFNPDQLKIDKRFIFQTLFSDASRKLLGGHKECVDFMDAGKIFEENGVRATKITGDPSEQILMLWDALACYGKANIIAHRNNDRGNILKTTMDMERVWNKLKAYSGDDMMPISTAVFGGHDEVMQILRKD